jgi:hypothetical protein
MQPVATPLAVTEQHLDVQFAAPVSARAHAPALPAKLKHQQQQVHNQAPPSNHTASQSLNAPAANPSHTPRSLFTIDPPADSKHSATVHQHTSKPHQPSHSDPKPNRNKVHESRVSIEPVANTLSSAAFVAPSIPQPVPSSAVPQAWPYQFPNAPAAAASGGFMYPYSTPNADPVYAQAMLAAWSQSFGMQQVAWDPQSMANYYSAMTAAWSQQSNMVSTSQSTQSTQNIGPDFQSNFLNVPNEHRHSSHLASETADPPIALVQPSTPAPLPADSVPSTSVIVDQKADLPLPVESQAVVTSVAVPVEPIIAAKSVKSSSTKLKAKKDSSSIPPAAPAVTETKTKVEPTNTAAAEVPEKDTKRTDAAPAPVKKATVQALQAAKNALSLQEARAAEAKQRAQELQTLTETVKNYQSRFLELEKHMESLKKTHLTVQSMEHQNATMTSDIQKLHIEYGAQIKAKLEDLRIFTEAPVDESEAIVLRNQLAEVEREGKAIDDDTRRFRSEIEKMKPKTVDDGTAASKTLIELESSNLRDAQAAKRDGEKEKKSLARMQSELAADEEKARVLQAELADKRRVLATTKAALTLASAECDQFAASFKKEIERTHLTQTQTHQAQSQREQAFFRHLDSCEDAVRRALYRESDLAIDLLCPICMRLMVQPVIAWPCSHTTCARCQRRADRESGLRRPPCAECAISGLDADAFGGGRYAFMRNRMMERLIARYVVSIAPLRRLREVFDPLLEAVRAQVQEIMPKESDEAYYDEDIARILNSIAL